MQDTVHAPRNPAFETDVRASYARQGMMSTMGAVLVDVKPGRIVIEVPFSEGLGQQQGLFHGAVIGAAGDSAAGYAAMSLLPPGSEVVTVEYKINFMRPAKGAMLRAVGEVLRAGRSVSVVRAEITCGDGTAMETCGVLQATMMRVEA